MFLHYTSNICDLPTSPVFCPHFGFIAVVWLEVFTVETIAGINLSHDQNRRFKWESTDQKEVGEQYLEAIITYKKIISEEFVNRNS